MPSTTPGRNGGGQYSVQEEADAAAAAAAAASPGLRQTANSDGDDLLSQ